MQDTCFSEPSRRGLGLSRFLWRPFDHPKAQPWPFSALAFLFVFLACAFSASAQDGTYKVTEAWSLSVNNPEVSGSPRVFTRTGVQSGTVHISGGSYQLINTVGASVGSLDAGIQFDGTISAQPVLYGFAEKGAGFYAVVKLSFFVVLVPLGTDWGFSLFQRDDTYSVTGGSFSDLEGAGTAIDGNNAQYVASSRSRLTPIIPNASAPKITLQPQSQIALPGSDVSFNVAATGVPAVSYQWQLGGTNLPEAGEFSGTTTPTLTVSGVEPADAGSYTVVASNAIRSVTSAMATLSIGAPLAVQVNGGGKVTPDFGGMLLAVGRSYTLTAKAGPGSVFDHWSGSILTNKSVLKFLMESNLNLIANFRDVKRPVCVVTFPPVNRKITDSVITATGKAKDNLDVSNVWYQLDGAGWNPAAIAADGTNWTAADLALLPGAHLLQAFASDGAGNASLTNKVKFSCIGSPVSLSGLSLTAGSAATGTAQWVFGTNTFSQTGGAALHEPGVGSYAYVKTGSAGAELQLTYDAPPAATNEQSPDIQMNFTTLTSGLLTNVSVSPVAYAFAIKPAKNLAPDSIAGKTLVATMAGKGKATIVLDPNGTFASSANPGIQEYGTYSYAPYSPVAGMLTLLYQDPAGLGAVNYLQLTFATAVSGSLINTLYHPDGSYKGVATATFTLH